MFPRPKNEYNIISGNLLTVPITWTDFKPGLHLDI